ncbi:MAG: heparin lyase I family protein [Dehalococcoidia bacterium]
MLDPTIAAAVAAMAAAVVGTSGVPAAVPGLPPPTCEETTHSSATAAAANPAEEVVEKIGALVAQITEQVRAGYALDVPSVVAALDRAGLPTSAVPGCIPAPSTSAGTPLPAPSDPATTDPSAAAATALAGRIIDALVDAGFVVHTPSSAPTGPAPTGRGDDSDQPDQEDTADQGDRGEESEPGPRGDSGAGSTRNGGGSGTTSNGTNTGGGSTVPRWGRPGAGAGQWPDDAATAPLPVPAPDPSSPPTAPWLPPTSSRPPTGTEAEEPPTTSGSSAAAIEQLLGDLATALSASPDPELQQLVEQLREVLAGGVVTGPRPGAGGLPSSFTDILPPTVTSLFSDDFEGGDLAKWGTCQAAGINGDCAGLSAADGMGVVEDPQRGRVAQFSVVDGKQAEMGGERSEVRDSNNPGTLVKEGDERWYAWSMKFPADFPDPDGGWNIVMQWHAGGGSPPLALDISRGTLDIGGDGVDAPRETIGPLRRGEWMDYVLHVGFSPDNGFVEAWENGVQTVPRTTRPTMSSGENYFKMGIYRDPNATGDAEVAFDDFAIFGAAGGAGDGVGGDAAVEKGDDTGDDTGGGKDSDGGSAPGTDAPKAASTGPRRPPPAPPGRTLAPPPPSPPAPAPSGVEV